MLQFRLFEDLDPSAHKVQVGSDHDEIGSSVSDLVKLLKSKIVVNEIIGRHGERVDGLGGLLIKRLKFSNSTSLLDQKSFVWKEGGKEGGTKLLLGLGHR